MSDRKLVILGIVAVLMVIWAVVQSRISSRPRTEPDAPAYLIQGLNSAHIGSIVLGVGEDAVTLKRQGGRFVVSNKDNYPAKTSEISKLITACLDVRIGELYTDDPANHKDLGVAEENAGTVVKFFKPDSSLLTGVVIAEVGGEKQRTYVRLASSDKVYMAPPPLPIRDSAMHYIDTELIAVKRESIESVTVVSPDDEYTLKVKEDGEGLVLENMPVGKKLKSNEADRVFTALTNLRFSDVKKKSAESEKLTFDRQFVCRLKDSTVYTVMIAQRDAKTYVSCKADFTDERPAKDRRVESEEELKEKEAKLLAWDRAKEFSVKHQGWIYEIADWKAESLTTKLSDLIEDDQKPKETEKVEDPNTIKVGDPNAISVGDPNVFKWLNE